MKITTRQLVVGYTPPEEKGDDDDDGGYLDVGDVEAAETDKQQLVTAQKMRG